MDRLSILFLLVTAACVPALAQGQTPQVSPAKSQQREPPARAATASPAPASSPASNTAAKAEEPCGCEVQGLPETFAVVNGMKITGREIDAQVGARVVELQRQVVAARKRELDLQINSKLLKAEAKKRGTSEAKLLEEEIISKVKTPVEADVLAFYEKNKGRIQGDFKDVQAGIVTYLLNQRQGEEARKLAERLRAAYPVKVLTNGFVPPVKEAERARVLALVNGEQITAGDLEDSLRPLIFQVQQQVYDVRQQELEMKINNLLLEQEAQKRKITTQALLDAELSPKVPKVTEADARKFYEQNQEKLLGDFAQLKDQIISYMQQREVEKAGAVFAEQLRRSAMLQVYLTAPEPPLYKIATADRPSKGNPSAPVTIVEFTDYQCPSCAKAKPVIEKLVQEYGDNVKLVVRSFPLAQHPNAYQAAEAAEAAFEQGKYWEYVTILMQNQSALETGKLKEYAAQVGIDRQKFEAALDSGKFAERVQRDIQDGISFGINSTPTLFVNGRQVTDKSYEALKSAIEAALKKRAAKNSGTQPAKT
jgi:protein-disulfide isomerase